MNILKQFSFMKLLFGLKIYFNCIFVMESNNTVSKIFINISSILNNIHKPIKSNLSKWN